MNMNLRTFLSANGAASVCTGGGVEMPHRARIGDDGDRLMKLRLHVLGPEGALQERQFQCL